MTDILDATSLKVYVKNGDIGEGDRTCTQNGLGKRKRQATYRPAIERQSLISRLVSWRVEAHIEDLYAVVRPPSFIIDDTSILKLARFPRNHFTDHCQVTLELNETQEWQEEWSTKIFNIIHRFDCEVSQLQEKDPVEKKTRQKRARLD